MTTLASTPTASPTSSSATAGEQGACADLADIAVGIKGCLVTGFNKKIAIMPAALPQHTQTPELMPREYILIKTNAWPKGPVVGGACKFPQARACLRRGFRKHHGCAQGTGPCAVLLALQAATYFLNHYCANWPTAACCSLHLAACRPLHVPTIGPSLQCWNERLLVLQDAVHGPVWCMQHVLLTAHLPNGLGAGLLACGLNRCMSASQRICTRNTYMGNLHRACPGVHMFIVYFGVLSEVCVSGGLHLLRSNIARNCSFPSCPGWQIQASA